MSATWLVSHTLLRQECSRLQRGAIIKNHLSHKVSHWKHLRLMNYSLNFAFLQMSGKLHDDLDMRYFADVADITEYTNIELCVNLMLSNTRFPQNMSSSK